MTALLVEIVGWMAAAMILAAYLLVSVGRVSGGSALFQWLNVLGAAGFILNSGWHGAMPSTILNIIWCAIGLTTLSRHALRR